MIGDITHLGSVLALTVILLSICAMYCIMVSRNLIRVLIGVELLTKAVTLLLVAAGYLSGQSGLAQALVITLIVVEVVVVAVAAGIVIGAFQRTGSLDASQVENLKG
jgi:NADH-quinone oxidoreductase subunit K